YTPGAQTKVDARKPQWSPELQLEVTRQWSLLFRDIETAINESEPPSGARAQALAARWSKLVEGFTGGDPEIQKGLNAMWADQANWPAPQRARFAIKPEIQDFIVKAMKVSS